jgi:hypothetical protein
MTLICFGASIALQQRFERLASNSAWTEAINDPYNLFVIILDELFLQVDGIVWSLSDVFRSVEEVSFNSTLVRFRNSIDLDRKRLTGHIFGTVVINWILSVSIMLPSILYT